MLSPHSPQGALNAHHAQLLRAVKEFTLELHVLQHRGDVRPVVLSHSPADSQVVAIPWKTPPPPAAFQARECWAGGDAQLRSGLVLLSRG